MYHTLEPLLNMWGNSAENKIIGREKMVYFNYLPISYG